MSDDTSNGPGRDEYFEILADYEEARFNMQRAASLAGKALQAWEKKGGDKADIRDGYAFRQMDPEDQQAELRRQMRVASWFGLIKEETDGQGSFAAIFDAKPPAEPTGLGGAPAGSRLAVVRAMTAGYNDGKSKNGPGLAEGVELYGWAADSEEALAYAQGWGDGNKLRPPPKAAKEKPGKSLNEEIAEELAAQEAVEAPKKRGRPPKNAPLARPAPELDADLPEGPSGPVH